MDYIKWLVQKLFMNYIGSVLRNYCMKCHKFYDAEYVFNSDGIPKCICGGIIKPDVVLYEFYLLGQARHLFVAVVQNNPHKLRQFHDACLGLLGVYVDESVDIIKGVHEDVRMYLPL